MKKTRTIYLLPYGGLCNRINAITSSIQFCKKHDIRLKIYWEKNEKLAANFSDLFKKIDIENVVLIELKWYHIIYFRAKKSNLFIPRFLRHIYKLKQIENWSSKSGDLKTAIEGNKTYLCTCHAVGDKGKISKIFQPKELLGKELNKIYNEFSSNTIGVHIRRGDHTKAIKESPIDWFHNKMDYEVEANKYTKFYLATDSLEIKNSLENKYKGRIITYKTLLERSSISGMYGAVVDLWALSATKKVIGTKLSMFSLVASQINDIKIDLK